MHGIVHGKMKVPPPGGNWAGAEAETFQSPPSARLEGFATKK
jgi:hypothetical protein